MSRLFRMTLYPVLLALPMVVASWAPARFFSDPRAIMAFVFMILGLAAENGIVDPSSMKKALSDPKRDRKSFELSAITNVACIYAPVFEYFHLSPIVPRSPLTLGIGLALMFGGEGIRISALRTLGRFFTMRVTILEGHTVVRDGLYAHVRHPAYTGWFLLFLGFGVYFGSIIGILGSSLFVAVIGWRVHVEEAALRESLGEPYERYVREVPNRFVPGLF
jgi:protein-S-isoprenylcysteine O-methyltransferase Ste14